MTGNSQAGVDEFVSSRAALMLAFAWGFCEATFFFIVPDVLLTLIAVRSLKPALKATVAALAGALIGGAFMYLFGARDPRFAFESLDRIPAISSELIQRVFSQINDNGLMAVLLGPIEGIPYKIYAVEWGARRGNFLAFILISIPARYVRFVVTTLIARLIARICEPLTHHASQVEITILAAIWITFYGLYFGSYGW
jgi:membrane protein YqaA with SNARE-associated domain